MDLQAICCTTTFDPACPKREVGLTLQYQQGYNNVIYTIELFRPRISDAIEKSKNIA